MFSSLSQSLWNRSSQLLGCVCRGSAAVQWQQLRTVVVVRRLLPPPIPKLGKKYTRQKKSHKVYILEEDTTHQPRNKLKLILTEDVPKIGNRGEVVMVDKRIGRNKVIPSGAAVYASPENIKEFAMKIQKDREESTEEARLSRMALKTIEHLKKNTLVVKMHADSDWTEVTKDHVIHAFKHRISDLEQLSRVICFRSVNINTSAFLCKNKQLCVMVPEHALKLPVEAITQCGTYQFEVTINDIETVPMEMEVVNFTPKKRISREAEES